MKTDFKSINDVENWLEPMNYLEFWYAIEPYDLPLCGQNKLGCDETLREGKVSEKTVLYCLKDMACTNLTERFGLQRELYRPTLLQVVE